MADHEIPFGEGGGGCGGGGGTIIWTHPFCRILPRENNKIFCYIYIAQCRGCGSLTPLDPPLMSLELLVFNWLNNKKLSRDHTCNKKVRLCN